MLQCALRHCSCTCTSPMRTHTSLGCCYRLCLPAAAGSSSAGHRTGAWQAAAVPQRTAAGACAVLALVMPQRALTRVVLDCYRAVCVALAVLPASPRARSTRVRGQAAPLPRRCWVATDQARLTMPCRLDWPRCGRGRPAALVCTGSQRRRAPPCRWRERSAQRQRRDGCRVRHSEGCCWPGAHSFPMGRRESRVQQRFLIGNDDLAQMNV